MFVRNINDIAYSICRFRKIKPTENALNNIRKGITLQDKEDIIALYDYLVGKEICDEHIDEIIDRVLKVDLFEIKLRSEKMVHAYELLAASSMSLEETFRTYVTAFRKAFPIEVESFTDKEIIDGLLTLDDEGILMILLKYAKGYDINQISRRVGYGGSHSKGFCAPNVIIKMTDSESKIFDYKADIIKSLKYVISRIESRDIN